MNAHLSHFIHQLSVKETLLARLGLAGLGFKGVNAQFFGSFGVGEKAQTGTKVMLSTRSAANRILLRMRNLRWRGTVSACYCILATFYDHLQGVRMHKFHCAQ